MVLKMILYVGTMSYIGYRFYVCERDFARVSTAKLELAWSKWEKEVVEEYEKLTAEKVYQNHVRDIIMKETERKEKI